MSQPAKSTIRPPAARGSGPSVRRLPGASRRAASGWPSLLALGGCRALARAGTTAIRAFWPCVVVGGILRPAQQAIQVQVLRVEVVEQLLVMPAPGLGHHVGDGVRPILRPFEL